MFKKSTDEIWDAIDAKRAIKSIGDQVDEIEVLAFNDFRNRLSYFPNIRQPFSFEQKTSSTMITLSKNNRLARYSWVSSGWGHMDRHLQNALKQVDRALWEPKKIKFHRKGDLPKFVPLNDFGERYDEIKNSADKLYVLLKKRFDTYKIRLDFTFHLDRCVLENSYQYGGSYEHLYSRLEYHLQDSHKSLEHKGLVMNFHEDDSSAEQIERKISNSYGQQAKSLSFVRKGQMAAVLAPSLVATLAQMIGEHCKGTKIWPPTFSKILPQDLMLLDDPTQGYGQNSVVFDHEGSPCKSKILVQGGERVSSIFDLQTAFLSGKKSTGNGFRRGMFVSHMADLTPVMQYNYLRIDPGKRSISKVVNECDEYLLLDQVTFPYDRFQDVLTGRALASLSGTYIKNKQVVSRVVVKAYNDRPLLSAFPKTHGSLIDPKSEILNEGEFTYTGWFPYIYLPRLTFGEI